jgi:hypothetical protein
MRYRPKQQYHINLFNILMQFALMLVAAAIFKNKTPKKVSLGALSFEEAVNLVKNGDPCIQAVYTVTEKQVREALHVRSGLFRALKKQRHETYDPQIYPSHEEWALPLNHPDVKIILSHQYYPEEREAIYVGIPTGSKTPLVFSLYPGKDGEVISKETQSSLGQIRNWRSFPPFEFPGTLLAQAPIEEGKKFNCKGYRP